MPVDLPSPSNLTPDEEIAEFPLQNDIEGNPIVAGPVTTAPLTSVPPRKARSRSPSPKLTLQTQSTLVDSPDAHPVELPPSVPDLLVDDTTLAGPSHSEASVKSEDSPVLIDAADVSSHQDPDTTIRLVGGGGVSGTSEDPLQADGVLVDEPEVVAEAEAEADSAAEVASIKSVDSKASTASKKHTRNKSSISSNLKKLGKLGGKRRTDSVASTDSKQ